MKNTSTDNTIMIDNVLYKIEPLEVTTYFIRTVSVFMILLLALNFKLNPVAISLLMFVPISIILFSRTSKIVLRRDKLMIEHINLIKKLSKITEVEVSNIKEVKYETEYKPIFRHGLPMSYMLSRDATITITLNNYEIITQARIGSKEKFVGLYEELKRLIESHQK